MKKPPYQKVLKWLIIIITVMVVGACVMFWVDGGLGALAVIFYAVLCSIALSLLFLFFL